MAIYTNLSDQLEKNVWKRFGTFDLTAVCRPVKFLSRSTMQSLQLRCGNAIPPDASQASSGDRSFSFLYYHFNSTTVTPSSPSP